MFDVLWFDLVMILVIGIIHFLRQRRGDVFTGVDLFVCWFCCRNIAENIWTEFDDIFSIGHVV